MLVVIAIVLKLYHFPLFSPSQLELLPYLCLKLMVSFYLIIAVTHIYNYI